MTSHAWLCTWHHYTWQQSFNFSMIAYHVNGLSYIMICPIVCTHDAANTHKTWITCPSFYRSHPWHWQTYHTYTHTRTHTYIYTYIHTLTTPFLPSMWGSLRLNPVIKKYKITQCRVVINVECFIEWCTLISSWHINLMIHDIRDLSSQCLSGVVNS